MKTDCVINANLKCQWKKTYTCHWLRLEEPRLGAHMTISTNFQRKIAELEISYGRALLFFIFLFTDKKTRVGVDTGSVGLVETRVFFYTLTSCIIELCSGRLGSNNHPEIKKLLNGTRQVCCFLFLPIHTATPSLTRIMSRCIVHTIFSGWIM